MPEIPTARPIRFYFRGRVQEVSDVAITRSTLDWLREDMACTGTKEGCNEGDCGACTVIVAELDDGPTATSTDTPASLSPVGGLRLRAINACLAFVPTLDGKALLTVEDLKPAAAGALHPVQQAMVTCHGSQCGFCTPGFVMSMTCLYEQHQARGDRPTRQGVADALSGNLCRCTGYRPILDAGEQMFDASAVRFDTAPIVSALQALATEPPLDYVAPNPAAPPRVDRFLAPQTLDAFAQARLAHPEARLLAGATDIGLWVNKQFRDVGDLLYVGRVDALKSITEHDGALVIGAAALLEDAWHALAQRVPALREVWRRFASLPTRQAGTLGGNIANGSPIGDGAPALMALGSWVVLRRGEVERTLRLEDFYLGYMKNALAPGEFITRLIVTLPEAGTQVRVWKISRRHDCDISALCAGFALQLSEDKVADIRIAFGGMAGTVARAPATEAALTGQAWTQATVDAGIAALTQDFTPLTDLRSTADKRQSTAGQLLQRLWLETRADQPVPATQTSVWAARRGELPA